MGGTSPSLSKHVLLPTIDMTVTVSAHAHFAYELFDFWVTRLIHSISISQKILMCFKQVLIQFLPPDPLQTLTKSLLWVISVLINVRIWVILDQTYYAEIIQG